MSGIIRYDSLLVRHLALELNRELRGQRVMAGHFGREHAAFTLQLEERTLVWETTAAILRLEVGTTQAEGSLVLPRRAAVSGVHALADERVLRIELSGGSRENAAHAIVLELLSGQRNAIALDEQDRVLKQLDVQGRTRQQRGQAYVPPRPRSRLGASAPISLQDWLALLDSVEPVERASRLIDRVAYLSRINADAVLAPIDLAEAYQRYHELLAAEPKAFALLVRAEPQPYGHTLWQSDAVEFNTLLAAIDSVARGAKPGATAASQLERDLERAQRKLARLQAESNAAAQQAADLRAAADLLLANVHTVKRGSREVELVGFDGNAVRLELDPTLSGTEQAQAWYEQARKRARAADQLPALIRGAELEIAKLRTVLERARAGEPVEVRRPQPAPQHLREPQERLPYRRYRTTGGLEVRVGRNSRSNDELTLRHASPNDIWMHARETGGAHVVLRWSDPDGAPPKQDLLQAAALAALHSKARHAGTVPVDWTRRKYVRKPRRAAAGSVLVERVKTLFVQPSADLEEKLRWKD